MRCRLTNVKLRRCSGKVHKEAHKSNPICAWVRINVSRQVSTRHPLRHNLEGVDSYTFKWDDVGVYQSLPYQSFLENHLSALSVNNEQLTMVATSTSLFGELRAACGSNPQLLDANLQATICSFVYIGKAAGDEGVFVDVEGVTWNHM